MNKPKLTYFDAPVSRGEECRLALHLAGVDFEDVRISDAAWPSMKEQMPYGALPVLELPGRPVLAHSNAILVLIGRQHGLHPTDDFEAGRHEGMMEHVEELRAAVVPTIGMGRRGEASRAKDARCELPAGMGEVCG
jgi:glutathione S-transferase